MSIVNDMVKIHSAVKEQNYGIHCLSNELKSTNSKDSFKKVILTWSGPICHNCGVCIVCKLSQL